MHPQLRDVWSLPVEARLPGAVERVCCRTNAEQAPSHVQHTLMLACQPPAFIGRTSQLCKLQALGPSAASREQILGTSGPLFMTLVRPVPFYDFGTSGPLL
jgi:hypothetical protein